MMLTQKIRQEESQSFSGNLNVQPTSETTSLEEELVCALTEHEIHLRGKKKKGEGKGELQRPIWSLNRTEISGG
jgi:hypothetical protein